jgi:hypothetical protein
MPTVADLNLITLHGELLMDDGTPAAGTVTITLPRSIKALRDAASEKVIFPKKKVIPLEDDGTFSHDIPATNDPDVSPTGFAYHIAVNVVGAEGGTWEFDAEIDVNAPGGSIDIATLSPSQSIAPNVTFVLQSVFNALEARVAALEALAGFGGVIDGGTP